MPSRLASGAYRSRVSRANSTEQGVLLSACQRSVRRREASRISTMRRSAAMASSILRCISFANRSRRRRRWRAGPPRPVAAAPRALHQPRHFLAKRGGDRIVAQRRRRRGQVGGQGGQQGRRAGGGIGVHAGQDADHARSVRSQRLPGQGLLALEAQLGQATAWSISARPSASRPSPASCRQEASKGVGASGTGEADMTGKLGGLQGNDQNISTLYTSVCPH